MATNAALEREWARLLTERLLDTQVLLWWLMDDSRLGGSTRQAIADAQNDIFVSAATGWEVAVKRALGKLRAPDELETGVKEVETRRVPPRYPGGDTGVSPAIANLAQLGDHLRVKQEH